MRFRVPPKANNRFGAKLFMESSSDQTSLLDSIIDALRRFWAWFKSLFTGGTESESDAEVEDIVDDLPPVETQTITPAKVGQDGLTQQQLDYMQNYDWSTHNKQSSGPKVGEVKTEVAGDRTAQYKWDGKQWAAWRIRWTNGGSWEYI